MQKTEASLSNLLPLSPGRGRSDTSLCRPTTSPQSPGGRCPRPPPSPGPRPQPGRARPTWG